MKFEDLKIWWNSQTKDSSGNKTPLIKWGSSTDNLELSTTIRTDSERKAILERRIVFEVARGARLTYKGELEAVFEIGKRPNHILHLLLSIVTFGFWLLVWLIMSMGTGVQSFKIFIDKFGNIHY